MGLPLDGVRVIEVGQALAGPLAGVILADMGAEVIKIEKPRRRRRCAHLGPRPSGRTARPASISTARTATSAAWCWT
ncbi:CoA transferase [Dankookia sp. P2]|uniref:CoA transferase n=1 Tax=Dankookia sp. P2 TaxID=3423955 RepID=UPI003D67D865